MNIIEILKDGRHYMERWPEEPLLNPVFPECRAKKLMSLAKRVIHGAGDWLDSISWGIL